MWHIWSIKGAIRTFGHAGEVERQNPIMIRGTRNEARYLGRHRVRSPVFPDRFAGESLIPIGIVGSVLKAVAGRGEVRVDSGIQRRGGGFDFARGGFCNFWVEQRGRREGSFAADDREFLAVRIDCDKFVMIGGEWNKTRQFVADRARTGEGSPGVQGSAVADFQP